MRLPKRLINLIQCIVFGGIVGVFLGSAVVITIGLVVTTAYQTAGHVVDNGLAPFAAFAGPWFLMAGPGAGVLAALVMWQVNGARSAKSIALLIGLPVGTLVATLASRGFVFWEQM